MFPRRFPTRTSRILRPTRKPTPQPLRRRTFATELPRPPPSEQPPAETFASPSRPRQYYARPRDLPEHRPAWPLLLVASVAGVGLWVLFLQHTANQERLASSLMQQLMGTLRADADVRAVLGDAVRFEPAWYLNGDPWISGSVGMLKGTNDLSFRVKGHKGAGTVYFTSIRKAKGEPFTTLRFKLIADDGTVVQISFH
ncbi:DUF1783-domain-containing protein [Amylostereum chailletii]|nr:DUF1783-domain-containing protein [Amylostereum chailletii]